MTGERVLNDRERRLAFDFLSALGASLDLYTVLNDASSVLLRLVSADSGALAVSRGPRPEDYEWIPTNLPPEFLRRYDEMAPHDFIRESVLRRPNLVLRDSEMIERGTLERNEMYQRARDCGVMIEQAMSVMLHVDHRWQSGLSLYRHERRPFVGRERDVLQLVTPAITNAVRNCRRFGEIAQSVSVHDALLARRGVAAIIVDARGVEVGRTEAATSVLEAWFPPAERRPGGLPSSLREALARATRESPIQQSEARTLMISRAEADLRLTCFALPGRPGVPTWVIELEEVPHPSATCFPVLLRLTPRQQEIAARLVSSGSSYKEIAAELEVGEGTVRTHVQNIYRAMKVRSRAELVAVVRGRRG